MSYLRFVLVAALSAVGVCSSLGQTGSDALRSARRSLMPVPASVTWRQGRLPVAKTFTVGFAGQKDERLRQYVFRFARRLEGRTVMEFAREASASPTLLITT